MTNGYTVDNYPEGAMNLPPRAMPHCGAGPIVTNERQDNQRGKPIRGSFVEFINMGQTLVWLNEAIPLKPGGSYYAISNPCLNAIWEFLPVTTPPTVDSKIVQAGNHLKIIIHKNKGYFATMLQPGGGIGGSTGLGTPTDISVTSYNGTTESDFTIPSAAIYVKIRNVGGLAPATITVNGNDLVPGGIIEREVSWDGVNRYILPGYAVVTNGSTVEYYYDVNPLI